VRRGGKRVTIALARRTSRTLGLLPGARHQPAYRGQAGRALSTIPCVEDGAQRASVPTIGARHSTSSCSRREGTGFSGRLRSPPPTDPRQRLRSDCGQSTDCGSPFNPSRDVSAASDRVEYRQNPTRLSRRAWNMKPPTGADPPDTVRVTTTCRKDSSLRISARTRANK